jgi:hypothetical protein
VSRDVEFDDFFQGSGSLIPNFIIHCVVLSLAIYARPLPIVNFFRPFHHPAAHQVDNCRFSAWLLL